MYYVALLCILALGCVSSVASKPAVKDEGCCLPRQMTLLEGMMLGRDVQGTPSVMMGGIFVAMDQDKQKTFSNISLIEDGKVTAMYVIQDYPKSTQYVVQGGKCMKSPLGAWVEKCIPKDARYLGGSYFGHAPDQKMSIPVNSYAIEDANNIAYISVTQEKECYPIMEAAHGVSQGVPYTLTVSFSNSTSTVKDPTIFNVPSICNGGRATMMPQGHPLGGSILFR